MLHTKFRENWPAGSGEKDFRRVFTIYGRGGHLGHVTANKLSFPLPKGLHINLALFGQVVLEEKISENVNGRTTTDGRLTVGIL